MTPLHGCESCGRLSPLSRGGYCGFACFFLPVLFHKSPSSEDLINAYEPCPAFIRSIDILCHVNVFHTVSPVQTILVEDQKGSVSLSVTVCTKEGYPPLI